jgi:hypothetical protein
LKRFRRRDYASGDYSWPRRKWECW